MKKCENAYTDHPGLITFKSVRRINEDVKMRDGVRNQSLSLIPINREWLTLEHHITFIS